MVSSARAFQSVTKSARDTENGASSRLKQASTGRKRGQEGHIRSLDQPNLL